MRARLGVFIRLRDVVPWLFKGAVACLVVASRTDINRFQRLGESLCGHPHAVSLIVRVVGIIRIAAALGVVRRREDLDITI